MIADWYYPKDESDKTTNAAGQTGRVPVGAEVLPTSQPVPAAPSAVEEQASIDTLLLLMADSMDTAVRESGVAVSVQGEPPKHTQAEWCREGARRVRDLAKRLESAEAALKKARREFDQLAFDLTGALKRALNDAEVIGNVTAALLDLNATYFGNQVTFTFESTNDAMSYIHKARRIVTERLERIQRELDGKGE